MACPACATIPPVQSSYSPKGSMEKVQSGGYLDEPFDLYTVGDVNSNRVVIVIYDIFGFHPNTQQFADLLAQCGLRVVMPDFFRGKPWPIEDFPPKEGFPALQAWIHAAGAFERISADLKATIAHCKKAGSEGAEKKFGVVGFCWGAKMAILESNNNKDVSAAALIHPSFMENSDAEHAQCPILLVPTKDEPPMDQFMEILSKKPFADKCIHKRFDDMHHGFAAARGDWSVPVQAERARETIQMTASFFKSNL